MKLSSEKANIISDLFAILVTIVISYGHKYNLHRLYSFDLQIEFISFSLAFLLSWFIASVYFRLYTIKRLVKFTDEIFGILITIFISIGIGIVVSFYIRELPLSRNFLSVFSTVLVIIIFIFRGLLKNFFKLIRAYGYDSRIVLLVGKNKRAEDLIKKIKASPEEGLKIIGYIDANGNGERVSFPEDIKKIGGIENLKSILTSRVIDEVYITLPLKSFYAEIEKIIILCEQIGIDVKLPAQLFSLNKCKVNMSWRTDNQLIDLYTTPRMHLQLIMKRFMDIIGSLLILILTTPLIILIAALIKMSSKGEIIFRQERVGYNGRLFNIYKFRTMVSGAEKLKEDLLSYNEMDGPVFKLTKDPRITKIGCFLRKTSLDELPQLFNVLKGDMSLVGPRPPLPSEVNQYVYKYRRRLSMKPGITCLWQIKVRRNSIDFSKWMELDMKYIDNWSLWLDIKILFKTIFVVLKCSGV